MKFLKKWLGRFYEWLEEDSSVGYCDNCGDGEMEVDLSLSPLAGIGPAVGIGADMTLGQSIFYKCKKCGHIEIK